ncbi:GNAT family N-acetyltransferase [Streptomyces sp. NPDC057697]|uniref:GNAT family N-acetyltransferase n=1 Tax=Streptomyces sp. NPDC057697 TaxID=3346219 RepID=UPI0036D2026E
MRIRTARPTDLPLLQDIERAAGEPFRALGMSAIADDDPPPLDLLETYCRAGRAWVAADADDRPVGYLLADPVDGAVHVEQVSVHPSAARRGVGSRLIDHLADWAAGRGSHALTLTTFTQVPWNAPYYARLGFRALGEAELTDGLRRIRALEAEHGLDRWPRVCMRREIPHTGHLRQLTGADRQQ